MAKSKSRPANDSTPQNGQFSNVVSSVINDVFGFTRDNSTEEVAVNIYSLDSRHVDMEMDSICYVPSHPSDVSRNYNKKRGNKLSSRTDPFLSAKDPYSIKAVAHSTPVNACGGEILDDGDSLSFDSDSSSSIGKLTPPMLSSLTSLDSHGTDCNSHNGAYSNQDTNRQRRDMLQQPNHKMTHAQLSEKVSNLQCMYEHLLLVMEEERKSLLQLSRDRDVTRKYLSKSFQQDLKAIVQRMHKLESHVVSLARSVAYVSSDVRQQHTLRQHLETVQDQVKKLQSTSMGEIRILRDHIVMLTRDYRLGKTIGKLKRFFGEDASVGLLEAFLLRLGYEKYSSKFAMEKVGILELPYLREDQFDRLGIPSGPRQRILAHLKYA